MFNNNIIYNSRIKKIKAAVKNENLDDLMKLGKKHGFFTNELRKIAWTLLLNVTDNDRLTTNKNENKITLKKQKQDTIAADIGRTAFSHYIKEKDNLSMKIFSNILYNVFNSNNIGYTQGFNHLASVIYIICNADQYLAIKLFKKLITTKLQKYSKYSGDLPLDSFQILHKIISLYSTKLYDILIETDENQYLSTFLFQWILSFGAHIIRDINKIYRIFDYILSHQSSEITTYICGGSLIYFKKELLNINDPTEFTCFLRDIEWDDVDIEKILKYADKLYNNYSPVADADADLIGDGNDNDIPVFVLSSGYCRKYQIPDNISCIISQYYPLKSVIVPEFNNNNEIKDETYGNRSFLPSFPFLSSYSIYTEEEDINTDIDNSLEFSQLSSAAVEVKDSIKNISQDIGLSVVKVLGLFGIKNDIKKPVS